MDEARAGRGSGSLDAAWSVAPATEEDELAALVVAVAVALDGAGSGDAATPPTGDQAPAWALAGRRQALRGRDGGPVSGWGRPRPTERDT